MLGLLVTVRGLIVSHDRAALRNRGGAGSGRQPLDHPCGLIRPVETEPVMHAAGPALPELDAMRSYDDPTPERRTRHADPVGEAVCLHRVALLQELTRRHDLRLRRSPSADLGTARAAREVGVRLRSADARRETVDPDLTLQRVPWKEQVAGGVLVEVG